MFRIKWDERQARLKLAALEVALSGAGMGAAIATKFSPHIQSVTEARFASEGDEAVGGTWRPLAPATSAMRAAQGYHPFHPINVRTGQMRGWATKGVFGGGVVAETSIKTMYPAAEPTGQLLNKMVIAQAGGKGMYGNPIPARPVLAYGPKDMVALLGVMSHHLQAVIRAA